MSVRSKFRTVSETCSTYGFRALSLKIASTYGNEFIHDHLLSLSGFERCTADNTIKMIYIPASDVDYIGTFSFIPQKGGDAVAGEAKGSWDKLRQPFEESSVYRSIKEVFVNGSEWSQTPKYERTLDRIQSGRRSWGCETLDELQQKTEYVDDLFTQITENGYKSQTELYKENNDDIEEYRNRMGDYLVPNELCVAIGRNGEIIRTVRGRHRTSIMKTIDDNTPIPAVIQFEHEEFVDELPYEKLILDESHELFKYSPYYNK